MRCIRTVAVASCLALAAGAAEAGVVIHGVKSSATTTVMHGGDRELLTMGFNGASTVFTGDNFLNFTDGQLHNNHGVYGWTDLIGRDVNHLNNHHANPDRADVSSAYLAENDAKGTLREVFGPFGGVRGGGGYKNMSYLIDGEDTASWTLDLFFGDGLYIDVDDDNDTVELALLERGRNSDLKVYGIREGGSLTEGVVINRSKFDAAGWTLDTLEIAESQSVGGVGLSLDEDWGRLIGFRFKALDSYNGPDLIAVGTPTPVPAPGSAALLVSALAVAGVRRRGGR